jgi:hypothetical protein
MSHEDTPYCLVLDTNAWVTERLLQSSVGNAVLYAIAADGASIGLPAIVEMEVNKIMEIEAGKALISLRRNIELLRQLSGHRDFYHPVPTEKAILDGIDRRWKELGGVLVRAPFTFEQAQSALQRVLNHTPPSGENNEQFRDCCIWESVLGFAESRAVRLVTNDSGFYQKGSGRDRTTIADPLLEELKTIPRSVIIHRTLDDFLATSSYKTIDVLERDLICDAIIAAVIPQAHKIAGEGGTEYELGEPHTLTIIGYATPKPSIVAVTFGVSFDLRTINRKQGEERQVDLTLRLDGSCSYNPSLHQTSDVLVSRWSKSVRGHIEIGWASHAYDPYDSDLASQLKQTRYI